MVIGIRKENRSTADTEDAVSSTIGTQTIHRSGGPTAGRRLFLRRLCQLIIEGKPLGIVGLDRHMFEFKKEILIATLRKTRWRENYSGIDGVRPTSKILD